MENNKNKIYNSYNLIVLDALFLKYGVSKYYIRKCLCGNAHGPKADGIIKDYARMEKRINHIIGDFFKENGLLMHQL